MLALKSVFFLSPGYRKHWILPISKHLVNPLLVNPIQAEFAFCMNKTSRL